MAEPSLIVSTALATGITVFGVSTGLDPAVLLAGMAGGLWAQSYKDPTTIWYRLGLIALAAILAGYLAPVFTAVLAIPNLVRELISFSALQLPVAVGVGLTSHQVLGPAIMRSVAKKVEESAK